MDFSISPELEELRQRTAHFIREKIIPLERDQRQFSPHESEAFRRFLNGLAAQSGLLAPHMGRQWGGLGLDHRGKAIVFEAAGYSVLGPLAMHISAPDEGNMHLLEQIASAQACVQGQLDSLANPPVSPQNTALPWVA